MTDWPLADFSSSISSDVAVAAAVAATILPALSQAAKSSFLAAMAFFKTAAVSLCPESLLLLPFLTTAVCEALAFSKASLPAFVFLVTEKNTGEEALPPMLAFLPPLLHLPLLPLVAAAPPLVPSSLEVDAANETALLFFPGNVFNFWGTEIWRFCFGEEERGGEKRKREYFFWVALVESERIMREASP